ncbi:hypothetical protein P3L10_034530 [Capsicum annuum]
MEDQKFRTPYDSINVGRDSWSREIREIRSLLQELIGNPARSKPTPVEFPRFCGENPELWISRAERYFDFYEVAEENKLSLASCYLDGAALSWYQWLFRNNQLVDPKQFTAKVLIRFPKQHLESLKSRLANQTPSVTEYSTRFEVVLWGFSEPDVLLSCPAHVYTQWRSKGNPSLPQKFDVQSECKGKMDAHKTFVEMSNRCCPEVFTMTRSEIPIEMAMTEGDNGNLGNKHIMDVGDSTHEISTLSLSLTTLTESSFVDGKSKEGAEVKEQVEGLKDVVQKKLIATTNIHVELAPEEFSSIFQDFSLPNPNSTTMPLSESLYEITQVSHEESWLIPFRGCEYLQLHDENFTMANKLGLKILSCIVLNLELLEWPIVEVVRYSPDVICLQVHHGSLEHLSKSTSNEGRNHGSARHARNSHSQWGLGLGKCFEETYSMSAYCYAKLISRGIFVCFITLGHATLILNWCQFFHNRYISNFPFDPGSSFLFAYIGTKTNMAYLIRHQDAILATREADFVGTQTVEQLPRQNVLTAIPIVSEVCDYKIIESVLRNQLKHFAVVGTKVILSVLNPAIRVDKDIKLEVLVFGAVNNLIEALNLIAITAPRVVIFLFKEYAVCLCKSVGHATKVNFSKESSMVAGVVFYMDSNSGTETRMGLNNIFATTIALATTYFSCPKLMFFYSNLEDKVLF